jgi:hypothetical protein
MEASQMLDVLHFYMEQDYLSSTLEEAAQKTRVRKVIYKQFYDIDYKYGVSDEGPKGRQYIDSDALEDEDDLSDVTAFSPTAKPYVPPTDFNPESPDPFGGVLDVPLG